MSLFTSITAGITACALPFISLLSTPTALAMQLDSIEAQISNQADAVTAQTPWGESYWYVNADVLHIGPGQLPSTSTSVPWEKHKQSLTKIVFDEPSATSLGQSAKSMFSGIPLVTHIEGINLVDTSQVTSMLFMFKDASSLESLDLSSWNTSKVTNMNFMFSGASALKHLNVSTWDTSNVAYMSAMFHRLHNITSLDVSAWNTSKVTSLANTFQDTIRLKELDLSNWDTSNVTSIRAMFNHTLSLKSLDLSAWNTSKITDMTSAFNLACGFESLDLSGWDTSKVSNMSMMFYQATALTTLDLSGWDTSAVTNMTSMFTHAPIETLTLGSETSLARDGQDLQLGDPQSGETFTGNWVSVDNGTSMTPEGMWTGPSSELYAQSAIGRANTYVWQQFSTLGFDANGGTGSMNPDNGVTGEAILVPHSEFVRLGHTFTGWSSEPGGASDLHMPGDTLLRSNGSSTLYAQWAPDPAGPTEPTDPTTPPVEPPLPPVKPVDPVKPTKPIKPIKPIKPAGPSVFPDDPDHPTVAKGTVDKPVEANTAGGQESLALTGSSLTGHALFGLALVSCGLLLAGGRALYRRQP